MGGLREDLSALRFCKDRFCKNDIDPKIRVPSVPSVPEYGSTLGTRTFQSVSLLFFKAAARHPVFGHRKSMVMKTEKFLTAGRNHFTKSCFSKPCTLFTEQWVFSLFQTKPYGTAKWDIRLYGQSIAPTKIKRFWSCRIFHCSVHLLRFGDLPLQRITNQKVWRIFQYECTQ